MRSYLRVLRTLFQVWGSDGVPVMGWNMVRPRTIETKSGDLEKFRSVRKDGVRETRTRVTDSVKQLRDGSEVEWTS